MFKKLVDKINLSNKDKLILSIISFIVSIVGGIVLTLSLSNIWSILVILGIVGGVNYSIELFEEAKKDYCFELSDSYFNKYKDKVKECDERYILEKLVGINKYCGNIQITTIPLSLVSLMLLSSFGVSLAVASTICASTCITSLFVTISLDNISNFFVDVLCEVLERVKASKGEMVVVSNELSIGRGNNKTFEDILTYGVGVSDNRYKYVPKDVSARDVSYEEIMEVVSHMSKVLKSTNTRM